MDRRRFLLTALAGTLTAPVDAKGATAGGKVYRVGTLFSSSREDAAPRIAALEAGLAPLGFAVGHNIVFVHRYADDARLTRVSEYAAELVQAGVDVVVTATNPTTAAMMKATSTIPIVMAVGVEPVSAGLVAGITKPGGNVTGLTFDVDPTHLAAKRLEILKELVPLLARAAVLWNPTYGPAGGRFKGTEDAGRKMRIAIISSRVTEPGELEPAFAELQRARAQALIVMSDPMTVGQRKRIAELAASHRFPAIYALREFVEAGGLSSYATSLVDQYRRAARYVARILKGAKPGDLPVEHPLAFELWINARAARTLGLTIPPSLLLRADQVIE
jgi:putative tryptophan/tyrosine transport system substrate-binding protein